MTSPLGWGIMRQGQIFHPAQVYEFLLNYLVFFILWRKRKNTQYDGQIFLWYVVFYAINRSIVEFFRTNPSVIGWFSVSHLLSVLFIIGAMATMYFVKEKNHISPETSENVTGLTGWTRDIIVTLVLMAVSLFIFYSVQG